MNQYPWWGYPPMMPPQNGERPLTQRDIERGIRLAMKTRDYDKTIKAKKKEEREKKQAASRAKRFLAIEWFILGAVLQPFVYGLYKALEHYINTLH